MIFRLALSTLILALLLLGCDGEDSSPAAGTDDAPVIEQGQPLPEALPSTDPVEPLEFEQVEPAPLPSMPESVPTTAPTEAPTTIPTTAPVTDATGMNIAPTTDPTTAPTAPPTSAPSPDVNLGAPPSTNPMGDMQPELLATPEISTRPIVIPGPGDVQATTDPITDLPDFTRIASEVEGEVQVPDVVYYAPHDPRGAVLVEQISPEGGVQVPDVVYYAPHDPRGAVPAEQRHETAPTEAPGTTP